MSLFTAYWPLFIILLLGIAIFLLLRLHITFHIVFTQINNLTRVRVGAYGLNKIVNIGLRTLYHTGNKASSDTLINESESENPLFSMPTLIEGLKLIHKFKVKHLQKMICDELKWETQVGINDPMGSALLCGSLWATKYYFIGMLSSKLQYREQPKISIQPLYNHIHFNTELKCLIRVRMRQAIWISIKLVWHLSKAKRKKKRQQKVLSSQH